MTAGPTTPARCPRCAHVAPAVQRRPDGHAPGCPQPFLPPTEQQHSDTTGEGDAAW
jgi:hypothetical protein